MFLDGRAPRSGSGSDQSQFGLVSASSTTPALYTIRRIRKPSRSRVRIGFQGWSYDNVRTLKSCTAVPLYLAARALDLWCRAETLKKTCAATTTAAALAVVAAAAVAAAESAQGNLLWVVEVACIPFNHVYP